MKNKISILLTISLLVIAVVGCNMSSTPTEKVSDTNTAKTDEKPKKESDKPKAAIKGSEKPEGAAKTAKKDNQIPTDWIYFYDENKGYGFQVPDGTTGDSGTFDGVDVFEGSTPAPSELGMAVIAFKDRRMTKDDLLDIAIRYLENTGETVEAQELTAESEDYSISTATTTMDGKKGKARILVGIDVTDNYIFIIGGDEDKFDAHEEMIDEIWGSFEMWSGGASGNN